MKDEELKFKLYKQVIIGNIITVISTTIVIVGVAVGTGSLHCFWGLLILLNIDIVK